MSEHAASVHERLAHALAVGAMTGGLSYVVIRTIEFAYAGPHDPLVIVRDMHVGYYWRLLHASFLGGAGAWAGWTLCEQPRRRARISAMLLLSLVPMTIAMVVASWMCP